MKYNGTSWETLGPPHQQPGNCPWTRLAHIGRGSSHHTLFTHIFLSNPARYFNRSMHEHGTKGFSREGTDLRRGSKRGRTGGRVGSRQQTSRRSGTLDDTKEGRFPPRRTVLLNCFNLGSEFMPKASVDHKTRKPE